MATYVYRCESCGMTQEESRSIHLGPRKGEDRLVCPNSEFDSHLAMISYMNVVIQTSLIQYGDFEMGDDDFSKRYWLNGEAGANGGKPNKTQGKTNINPIIRKYGKKGKPLELRDDIDANNLTSKPLPDWSNGQKGGHVPAPDPLRSSTEILSTTDLK